MPHKESLFLCSCCGCEFRSTYQEQAKHDQDTGYGHCPRCQETIEQKNNEEMDRTISILRAGLRPEQQKKLDGYDRETQELLVLLAIKDGVLTYSIKSDRA